MMYGNPMGIQGSQIVEYNGEYYLMPNQQTTQSYGGSLMGIGMYNSNRMFNRPGTPQYDAMMGRMIESGQLTPFSNMLQQRPPATPITPTPFAGWGEMGGGQSTVPTPAVPQMRNPQATQAPANPVGNTQAGGTNWDLAKINAFQNTGR